MSSSAVSCAALAGATSPFAKTRDGSARCRESSLAYGCHDVGVRLVHARRHAVVRRLDNDADALRFQDVMDGVGNLRGHFLLNLQAPGIDVDHARELADADHAAIWNVGYPGLANDRRHV